MSKNINQSLSIRVSQDVKTEIENIAARRGQSISEYGRQMLTNEAYNKDVIESIQHLTKLVEACLMFTFGASAAVPALVRLTNEESKNILVDLDDAVKNERKTLFANFMHLHMGGISELMPELPPPTYKKKREN